jgi:hypothetical protein
MISDSDEFLRMQQKEFNESWLSEYSTLLRGSIWHLTSPLGISGIKKSGYIEPNLGSHKYTFPQSENSYGKLKGYICLFDFFSVDEKEFLYTFYRWRCFFWHHKPFTIALELNREYLMSNLILNQIARQEVGYKKVWIPYVEVWYPKRIPISAIDRYFVIYNHEKSAFLEVTKDKLIDFMEYVDNSLQPKDRI